MFSRCGAEEGSGVQVAVKLVKKGAISMQRVRREVLNLRLCAVHPHIITFRDVRALQRSPLGSRDSTNPEASATRKGYLLDAACGQGVSFPCLMSSSGHGSLQNLPIKKSLVRNHSGGFKLEGSFNCVSLYRETRKVFKRGIAQVADNLVNQRSLTKREAGHYLWPECTWFEAGYARTWVEPGDTRTWI